MQSSIASVAACPQRSAEGGGTNNLKRGFHLSGWRFGYGGVRALTERGATRIHRSDRYQLLYHTAQDMSGQGGPGGGGGGGNPGRGEAHARRHVDEHIPKGSLNLAFFFFFYAIQSTTYTCGPGPPVKVFL